MLKDLKWEQKALRRPVRHSHIWWWQWRKALLVAADLIEERGWTRGRMVRDGKLCAVGALQLAVHGDANSYEGGVDDRARERLRSYINLRLRGNELFAVQTWNDIVAKDASEVIATMRAAARA